MTRWPRRSRCNRYLGRYANCVYDQILPYTFYVMLTITNPDLFRLKHPRLILGLVAITVTMFTAAYFIGFRHDLFLTCHDFEVTGDYMPENCRQAP